MTHHVLTVSTELLRQHYGAVPRPAPAGEWQTLVRVVLENRRQVKKPPDWSWLDESPLRTAEETLVLRASRLVEILEANHQAAGCARTLYGCANWWQQIFCKDAGPADFTQRSLESWQEELRAIPGVNWEMADRILLVVGRQAVYPLDRGSMRIVARHGWVATEADYDEWQTFFRRGLHDSHASLAELAHWSLSVGRDYCRSEPKCDECPLRSLLPERGPVQLSEG
jgi:endonuclease III